MSHFVVSDHHFGHANIIEYCDRLFSSVGEMDSTLLDRHFEVVNPDDVVVHLGDVAMDMRDGTETIERMEAIGGDVLVQRNHDVVSPTTRLRSPSSTPVRSATVSTHSIVPIGRKTCQMSGMDGSSTATSTTTI